MRIVLRIVVFDWRLERFAAAEAMSPMMLWRIYQEHDAHQKWVAKQHKGKRG